MSTAKNALVNQQPCFSPETREHKVSPNISNAVRCWRIFSLVKIINYQIILSGRVEPHARRGGRVRQLAGGADCRADAAPDSHRHHDAHSAAEQRERRVAFRRRRQLSGPPKISFSVKFARFSTNKPEFQVQYSQKLEEAQNSRCRDTFAMWGPESKRPKIETDGFSGS